MGKIEAEEGKRGFKITLKEGLLILAGTALALGSFKSDDAWVVIPMLSLSGVAFVWLCLGHQGIWAWKIMAAVLTVAILFYIGWRDLRRPQELQYPHVVATARSFPQPAASTRIIPTPSETSKSKEPKPRIPSHPSHTVESPQKQQQCQTGSICNQDSPNQGTQIVNNGPPPAKLIWAQFANEPIHDLETTKVTVDVDHILEVPEFIVTCDRPCTVNAMGSGYGGWVYFDHQERMSPTKLKLIFGSPRPMAPGSIVWVYLGSEGAAPKIISFDKAEAPARPQ
jgi:hypothetical protein